MTLATKVKPRGAPSAAVADLVEARPSIFIADPDLWTSYEVRLLFRARLIGGVPKDPQLIEGWLRNRAGISDERELRLAVLATLAETSADDDDAANGSNNGSGVSSRITGFKTGPEGLYVEGRQVKAMLKESTNIVFAGERWGPTRKAARSFFAERVFVDPDRLALGVRRADGVETFMGHLNGPAGPRSTLNQYEYVDRSALEFRLRVLHDCVSDVQWRAIWCHAQESGFGTLRSQGFGRFDVVRWERLSPG